MVYTCAISWMAIVGDNLKVCHEMKVNFCIITVNQNEDWKVLKSKGNNFELRVKCSHTISHDWVISQIIVCKGLWRNNRTF